jgi:hypothetical protein
VVVVVLLDELDGGGAEVVDGVEVVVDGTEVVVDGAVVVDGESEGDVGDSDVVDVELDVVVDAGLGSWLSVDSDDVVVEVVDVSDSTTTGTGSSVKADKGGIGGSGSPGGGRVAAGSC